MAVIDRCVRCNGGTVKVINSRSTPLGRVRRRRCLGCEHRWSTVEVRMHEAARFREAAEVLRDAERALGLIRRHLAVEVEDEE